MAATNINVRVDSALKQETKAALAEYEEMKANPEKYRRYGSFDEILDK